MTDLTLNDIDNLFARLRSHIGRVLNELDGARDLDLTADQSRSIGTALQSIIDDFTEDAEPLIDEFGSG